MRTIRTSMLVVLIAGIGLGCAGESRKRGRKLDYCTCLTWGVVGAYPGPDYSPPRKPPLCKLILKRQKGRDCPIPP